MSKLDELDKGFREMRHLFYSSAEYERVKDFARKYYDLGKLEEREALKKMAKDYDEKMECAYGNCRDCSHVAVARAKLRLFVEKFLSTLNNEK